MTRMIDQAELEREAPTFQDYPLTMVHPAFVPSKVIPVEGTQRYDTLGRLVYQDTKGTPERLPPVTVLDADQEEYYRAQGYERAGKIDPAAWVRAHADAPGADYVPLEYPRWVGGVLYMTAQEDPTADPDYRPPEPAAPIQEAPPTSEAANLRAEMAEIGGVMQQMRDQMQALAEDNARLKAEAEERAARKPIARSPGRPRKAAQSG